MPLACVCNLVRGSGIEVSKLNDKRSECLDDQSGIGPERFQVLMMKYAEFSGQPEKHTCVCGAPLNRWSWTEGFSHTDNGYSSLSFVTFCVLGWFFFTSLWVAGICSPDTTGG